MKSLFLLMMVTLIGICSCSEKKMDDMVKNAEEKLESSKINLSKSGIALIANGIEAYYRDNGFTYPSTEQGLRALFRKPTTEPVPHNWNGPYGLVKKRTLNDPWNNEYQYRSPGIYNETSYDLYSMGPNGVGMQHCPVGSGGGQPPPIGSQLVPSPP